MASRSRQSSSRAIPTAFAVALVATVTVALPRSASADAITYVLDQSNVDASLPDGVNYATVTIDDSAANSLRFSISLLPTLTSIQGSNFGIDNFAFNVLGTNPLKDFGTVPGQWSLPSGWTANIAPPPNQADGFGRFDAAVDGGGGARLTSLVFQLNNTGLGIYDFAKASSNNAGQGNVYFSAHIAGFDAPGGVTSGFFGGSKVAPIPLPATLLLFASALLGITPSAIGRKTI